MESLNNIVEKFLSYHKKYLEKYKNIKVEVMLASDMPEVYELESGITPKYLRDMLVQLSIEVEDGNPSKALYETKLENDVQKLILSHNGKQIPEDILKELNKKLRLIAEKTIRHDSMRHGNLIAAQALQEHGGSIYVENMDGEYTVRTTVELPLKS